MTLEQAKQESDILEKIDKNNEMINNLKFYRKRCIALAKGNNVNSLTAIGEKLLSTIADYSIHILIEENLELEQELKLLQILKKQTCSNYQKNICLCHR